MLKFSDLAEIMDGQILHLSQDHMISKLLIDSRQLVVHPEAIFFAIRGPNHDGHQYLEQVLSQNVVNFVVEQSQSDLPPMLAQANVISVKNSIRALQALAAYHRSKFSIPVLGITGSNAKTIIKEWLFQLLDDKQIVKSPKSYNSQVGVPLSVWQLNDSAEMAIFEAGVSRKGEMDHIASIIRPSVGIFTNIGTAHDAGFKGAREKVLEKCKLFREASTVIYRRDHSLVHQELSKIFPSDQRFSWSTNTGADIEFQLSINESDTTVRWETHNAGEAHLPFTDNASIENALHCLTFLIYLGYEASDIDRRMRILRNIPHRLALKPGINNCHLVDDTYNNDLAGLDIALEFLNQQPHGKGRVVVLSDIKQASTIPEDLYGSVAERIRSHGIEKFYGIGEGLSQQHKLFPAGSKFFTTTEDFTDWLSKNLFSNQLVLIKGARDFAFENIVQQLTRKHHGTVLEINLDALAHNLNLFRKRLSSETKVMVMVKAFAYGTGSHEVANLLQYHGIDYLGVAYIDEGIDLRKKGISLPIMVMNPSPESFDQLLHYNLEPEIYSPELLRSFQEFCQQKNRKHPIHLKIDTGMHRLGFDLRQISGLTEELDNYKLPVVSVFSHLAAAEDPDEAVFNQQQFDLFAKVTKQLEESLGYNFIKHILNTEGILHYPEYQLDMVRLGIGLYGVGSQDQLRNIGTLKTTISQIKHIPAGETIGYNRSGKVKVDSQIATIAIGYADGYDRRFGNRIGKVQVAGKLVPVVGNICMDMTMIDVTNCSVSVGDQVIVFGEELRVGDIAGDIGTIPYELLTKISERVKRVYFLE